MVHHRSGRTKSSACWFPHCTSPPALSSRRCADEYLSRGPRKGLRQVVMPKQDAPSLGDSPCISACWFPTRHRAAEMLQLCARRHHPRVHATANSAPDPRELALHRRHTPADTVRHPPHRTSAETRAERRRCEGTYPRDRGKVCARPLRLTPLARARLGNPPPGTGYSLVDS